MITIIETDDDRIFVTAEEDVAKVISQAKSDGVDIRRLADIDEDDICRINDSYAIIEIERRISCC